MEPVRGVRLLPVQSPLGRLQERDRSESTSFPQDVLKTDGNKAEGALISFLNIIAFRLFNQKLSPFPYPILIAKNFYHSTTYHPKTHGHHDIQHISQLTMATKTPIGFAGLGAMGFGMATHLVKQGHPVTGFDVWGPTLEKFAAAGGTPSTTLSASAKDKDFYIVMVATAQQAQQALFDSEDGGIVSSLPKGATLLLCSTVPSAYAQQVEKELEAKGRGDILFIDAPVSGGAIRAADGTLSIMAGASEAAFQKGQWLLEELSAPSKLFIVKGGVGAGSNMKMVHQVLAAIQILSTSEAYGFGARLGLNGKDVRDAVLKSPGWSWMFENRGVRTLAEDYFPGASAVGIIMKDTVCFPFSSPSPTCKW